MYQWEKELTTKTDRLKVYKYYGPTRTTKKRELEEYDVILTTYAILEYAYRKEKHGIKSKGDLIKQKSLLHSLDWDRLILDEAHSIKDRYSSTAKSAFTLKSEFTWCLSGTPMQNRIGELFSLVKLLDIFPHAYYFCTRCPCKLKNWIFTNHIHCDECGHTGHQHFNYWNREILKPIQKFGNAEDGKEGFRKIGLLLKQIMVRRTKIEYNDELGLPPR
jgi:DNA repair protein RAD16